LDDAVQTSSSGLPSNEWGEAAPALSATSSSTVGPLPVSSKDIEGLVSLPSSADSLSQDPSSLSSSLLSCCPNCGQRLQPSSSSIEGPRQDSFIPASVVLNSSSAVDNSPTAQLTQQEFQLLESNVEAHRKGSFINWTEVFNAWNTAVLEKQPGIYARDIRRLQTALKNRKQAQALKEKAKASSRDQVASINIVNSSSSSSSSGSSIHPLPSARQQQLQLSSSTAMRSDGVVMRSVLGPSVAASVALGTQPKPQRTERSGDLTTAEHEVVKRVAEDCARKGILMSHTAVTAEYHRRFPDQTRNKDKLMNYWKTYKTSATWAKVVAGIAAEKLRQQQSQSNL
jgi:hypothetical protein